MLLAGPAPEVLKFIQILSWITLPALMLALIITIILHYRKKKRGQEGESAVKAGFLDASPEQLGYTKGDGEFVLFDYSSVIKEYKNRLLVNHARYAALQLEFAAMGKKYTALAKYAQTQMITSKKQIMSNLHEQAPGNLQKDINKILKDEADGKRELQMKVEQLEQENIFLQEQIKMGNATDEERTCIIKKWKEENDLLRSKIADQEYLQDLVDEKKAQVVFLQNQLEQRIKNLYQSEHQRLQTVAELKQAKDDNEAVKKNSESLQNELLLKQEYADKIQVVICEKEEQVTEKQTILNEKLDHIIYLGNAIREAREQNELLTASAAENRSQLNVLQKKLTDEQSKVEFLTQKLFVNKQMMRRLSKELLQFVDEESEESLVIPLRPEYNNREDEEIAIQ